MSGEHLSDRHLIESDLRVPRPPGHCYSLVVGTNADGERAVHRCNVTADTMMHGHKTHHCDCGQSWRYIPGDERWSTLGPLTDVVFDS